MSMQPARKEADPRNKDPRAQEARGFSLRKRSAAEFALLVRAQEAQVFF